MKLKFRLFSIVVLGCMWICGAPLAGQTLQTRTVIDNIGIPWEILWGPDNMIWMTERQGQVSRLNPETGEVLVIATIPEVKQGGEGGLLGMALHPDFPTTPQVFLAYTYDRSGGTGVRIVRYTYDNNTLTSPVTLIEDIRGSSIHNGCRLLFAPDRTLLITTGDAANQSLPQSHTSLNGKVLRINTDGTLPADNPWPGSMLYTTGHRNAQGICFGPGGKLYSSEHGPNNDDEVNLITSGRNYGWPNVHGFCDLPAEQTFCTDSNVVQPLAAWTPTLAVCGMEYYNHSAIPEWQNSLLVVTLKASKLLSLQLNEDGSQIIDQKEYLVGTFGRLRDVCIAPDGRVFVSTSNGTNDNKIIEIKREEVSVPVEITVSADTLDFGTLMHSDTEAEQQLTITNTGSTSAIITALAIRGSGSSSFNFSNAVLPLVMQPEQSITLTVHFRPVSAGQKNATLSIVTIDEINAVEVTLATVYLTGRKTSIEIGTTLSVDFGTIPVNTTRDTTLTDFIRNTGDEDVELTALDIEPPFLVVEPATLPFVIPRNTTRSVTLRFAPQQEGVHLGVLTMQFGEELEKVTVLNGTGSIPTSVGDDMLHDGSLTITPNPVWDNTTFSFRVGTSDKASVEIVDMMGRVIFGETLQTQEGVVRMQWNGRDNNGHLCPPGAYRVIISTGRYRATSAFTLLR